MLGTARYREIEEAHPMTPLAATLHALKRQGELDFDDVDLLSRMVDAVICKVAIMLPGQRIRRSSGRAGRRSSTACSGGGGGRYVGRAPTGTVYPIDQRGSAIPSRMPPRSVLECGWRASRPSRPSA